MSTSLKPEGLSGGPGRQRSHTLYAPELDDVREATRQRWKVSLLAY